MFVNGNPFMVSVLGGVNFKTVEYASRRSKTVTANSIGKMFQLYKNNGYNIKTFFMDSEFDCIRD